MKETKTPTAKQRWLKGIWRQRLVYSFLRVVMSPFLRLIYGFKCKPYTPKSSSCLILANHNMAPDQFFLGMAMKKHMRFVASENILRNGIGGRLIKFLQNPIPRKKGADASDTVESIKENLALGVNVCMFAEGNRSSNGETCFISPRTGEMVKESTGGLVTFRIIGGYLQSPRWSRFSRKGYLSGEVVHEYERSVLDKMTADEINEAIRRDLFVNAFEEQRRNMHRYKGKRLAENLEKALYICPVCHGVSTMKSDDDTFRCHKCGHAVKYNEYGFFEGEKVIFDNVYDWDMWQRSYAEEHKSEWLENTSEPISVDSGISLYRVENSEMIPVMGVCSAAIYGDRLEFSDGEKHLVCRLADIERMGMFTKSTVLFTHDGGYYQFRGGRQLSPLKFFALYRILSGQRYY